jgi:type I restriction enzyme S subunit
MKAGWEVKTLDEVCLFENGDRGENYPSKAIQTTSGVPFINAGHLTDFGIDYETMNYIPRERFNLLGNGKVRKNDILFCLRGSLGKFATVGDLSEGAIASSLVIVRPKVCALNKYILAYFQSDLCAKMIDDFRNGTAQPNLSAGNLKKFIIPIPPLLEQQRIVAILDAAFASIATAKANTEQNLKNARALFDSYLHEVFRKPGENWKEERLVYLCEPNRLITYGVIKLGNESLNGVPCLRTSNVRWLHIDTKGIKRIEPTLSAEYSRTILKGNEVLVNVRGTLGGVAVVPYEMAGWNVSREVAVVPVDTSKVNPLFLSYFIGSNISQEWLGNVKKGAAYIGINIEDLRLLPVSIPQKIEKQLEIVHCIQALRSETQRLETLYQRKLAALDELKKALLHQAFNGEL